MLVNVYLSASTLVPVSLQNSLIRELEHTKKLIEDSHHEKVRDHCPAPELNLI